MTNVNGFLKENEDVVTLLRAVEREQSTKTVLRVDTSVLRGLASKPFSILEEHPPPHRMLLDGRQSPYLLE